MPLALLNKNASCSTMLSFSTDKQQMTLGTRGLNLRLGFHPTGNAFCLPLPVTVVSSKLKAKSTHTPPSFLPVLLKGMD